MALEVEDMKEEEVAGIEDITSDETGNNLLDMITETAENCVQEDYEEVDLLDNDSGSEPLDSTIEKDELRDIDKLTGTGTSKRLKNTKQKCEYCEKVFASSYQLKMHKMSNHDLSQFPCDLCIYVALNPENLKLHTQKWHSSESTESPPKKVNNKKVKCLTI